MEINNNIILNSSNGIEYIQFKKLLDYGIKHAYTLKGNGLNFRSNSEEEKSSYKKIFDALDLDVKTLVKPFQSHTSNVKCIDKVMSTNDLKNIDGLITNKKNITLVTTNADCILFLLYDPIKKVIANDILCFICPSIRKCHFEVDEDVKILCEDIFDFTGRTNEFIEKAEIKDGVQKYKIDTILINKILLTELGIKDENIIDCNICSVCNSDKISSFRVEGKEFKLATSLISL